MFHVLLSVFFFVKLNVANTLFLSIIATQNVGDVLPLGSPHHIVAELLHLTAELHLAFALFHAVVDSNAELYLPAVAVDRSTVFLRIGT